MVEFDRGLKDLYNNKAVGIDKIPMQFRLNKIKKIV